MSADRTVPRGNSLASRDIASLVHPYTNLAKHPSEGPLIIERGKGIYVYDDSGKEYIEGLAGLWCTALGFGEQRLADAAARQMTKLPFYHVFASKSHEPGIELAERLLALAPVPMSKVFFATTTHWAGRRRKRSSRASAPITASPSPPQASPACPPTSAISTCRSPASFTRIARITIRMANRVRAKPLSSTASSRISRR
jgi:hypothetical protein